MGRVLPSAARAQQWPSANQDSRTACAAQRSPNIEAAALGAHLFHLLRDLLKAMKTAGVRFADNTLHTRASELSRLQARDLTVPLPPTIPSHRTRADPCARRCLTHTLSLSHSPLI